MEEKYLKIIEAAKAGGAILRQYFGQDLAIEEKSMPADFFTKADTESERAILEVLKKEYPNYNIYSEEDGKTNNGSEYTFVIDPLDGSNNFVVGVPNFSVSIALTKGKNIEAGVIYQPILDRVYYAQKGKGAFLNGKKISVSRETDSKRAGISYVASYGHDAEDYGQMMKNLETIEAKRVFYNWSVAMDFCYLASGKMEAIINEGCEVYDYLAGKIIAKEAGALILDFSGSEEKDENGSKFVAVNNRAIFDKLLKILS
ncbi:inositol monophosphatase [Candidatus Parcubacteria bacterium]|nr:MAG: inositol monophosphatase [Candidatus Parcubacteria bacterium]